MTAEHDPVVGGQPVVVGPVGHVGEALASAPADRAQQRGGQRLGGDRVAVHGQGMPAVAAQQGRERAGRQQHAVRQQGRLPGRRRRAQDDGTARAALRAGQAGHPGLLEDLDAEVARDACELGGQTGGMYQRGGVGTDEARLVRRARDLGAHLRPVEEGVRGPGPGGPRGGVQQPVDLVRLDREVDHARALPLAVQTQVHHRRTDGREVLLAEPDQRIGLIGRAAAAVVVVAREARAAEPAVAARRRPSHRPSLHQHDPRGGVPLLRAQRRPQAGVPAADHGDVGAGRGRQGGKARPLAQVVQPEHRLACGAEGVVDDSPGRYVALEDGLLRTGHARNLAKVR